MSVGVSVGGWIHPSRRRFEEALEYAEQQQAVTRCALCKSYTRGTVGDGKAWFEQHMELKHGATVRRKR